ncbi:MAG TPA: TetR/AcrR family transcriptional regulator, partial [Blastocatellia bacterium]|nr:TetR/AcrR family transcriptional regulator [Blastocatellia bacterium]
SLIREKDYDSIVVKEILDRANVGRSAFYMHFRDKDELLASSIHDMLGAVSSPHTKTSVGINERILWFSLPIFEHLEKHRREGGLKLGARGRAILHGHLRHVVADIIAEDVRQSFAGRRKPSRKVPTDVVVQYVASTFILVLNWWVETRSPLSSKEINELFRALILPTLAAISD